MPPAEPNVPLRGCPFAGRSRLGVEPEGPECLGFGRCQGCPLASGDAPLVAGRYAVERFLASGYYADVFQAWDLVGDDAVALKVYAGDPPRRSAWRHETAALSHLAHPRIPRLRTALECDAWLVVAMDLVPGTALRERVEASGPLDWRAVVGLGIEVGEALEHVASLGWTYRDLHPRNVHVGTPIGAMLLDFDGARPPGWPAAPSGRIGYRAPELEVGEGVSPACDVYSLAGCLCFALTGSDPPTEPGPLPHLVTLPVDHPLERLLDDCRAESPGSRPAVPEVLVALREA